MGWHWGGRDELSCDCACQLRRVEMVDKERPSIGFEVVRLGVETAAA